MIPAGRPEEEKQRHAFQSVASRTFAEPNDPQDEERRCGGVDVERGAQKYTGETGRKPVRSTRSSREYPASFFLQSESRRKTPSRRYKLYESRSGVPIDMTRAGLERNNTNDDNANNLKRFTLNVWS